MTVENKCAIIKGLSIKDILNQQIKNKEIIAAVKPAKKPVKK